MFRLRVLSVLAVSSVIAAACSAKQAPGIVMLTVSTNLVPGRDFDRGLVVVAVDGATDPTDRQDAEFGPEDSSFPFTVALRGLEPDENANYVARVRVILVKDGRAIIGDGSVVAVRDLSVELPGPRETTMAHVSVDWLSMLSPPFQQLRSLRDSFGDSFPRAQSACTNTINALGECTSLRMEEDGEFDRKVEPYDPTKIFGGGESADDPNSTCFPAKTCFAGADTYTAALVGERCQFDVGAAGNPEGNVAVMTAATDEDNVARCGADGCGDDLGTNEFGVVLDREAVRVEGTIVTLPAQVCARLPGGAPVRVSNVCPAKTRAIPLCPEVPGAIGRVETPRRLP